MAYVNKMDMNGADFFNVIKMMKERLNANAVPIQLPIGHADEFCGIIDLVEMDAVIYKDDLGKEMEVTEIPANMMEMAKKHGVENVYIHAILDGRDVPPASAADDLEILESKIAEIGVGKIATVTGRFYAMDRDNIWDRVEKAYAAFVYGKGIQADDPVQAVRESYETSSLTAVRKSSIPERTGSLWIPRKYPPLTLCRK